MKALDTNVIVRFLVRDDPAMTDRARQVFEHARDTDAPLLISNLVLLETLWVLGSTYRFSRQAILDAMDRLQSLPGVRFDSHEVIREFLRLGRSTSFDLADILIGLAAKQQGCETTLTLDKKAAQSELFEEIP